MRRRLAFVPAATAIALGLATTGFACNPPEKKAPSNAAGPADNPDHPPVAINPISPIEYPPALVEQQIDGRVLLRLYIDSAGTVKPDSSRVAESSGYPALDSAALRGASGLRFAPALHRGRPVALSFIQPVLFRSPRARGGTP